MADAALTFPCSSPEPVCSAPLPRVLPRVWCPELSVLDWTFANGERLVWLVPARPGNDA